MATVGFLGHALSIVLIVVGLLSGALSVLREMQLMYHPPAAEQKKVFWGFVRVAFVITAVIFWSDEHDKVVQLLSKASAPPIQVTLPPITIPPAQVVIAPTSNGEAKASKPPKVSKPKPTLPESKVDSGGIAVPTSPPVPPPENVRIVSQEDVSSDRSEWPYKLKVVL